MSGEASSISASGVKETQMLVMCALLERRQAVWVVIVDSAGSPVLYSRLSALLILMWYAVFLRDGVGDLREPYAGEEEAWEGETLGRISAIGHSAIAGGRDSGR